jgi:hypothetical protein
MDWVRTLAYITGMCIVRQTMLTKKAARLPIKVVAK